MSQHTATAPKNEPEPIAHPPDYWQQLVQSSYHHQEDPSFGEFRRLQHLNLTYLLNDIVSIKATIKHHGTTSRGQMELLRQLLHHYGKANRYSDR
jgi:hypothetical protein